MLVKLGNKSIGVNAVHGAGLFHSFGLCAGAAYAEHPEAGKHGGKLAVKIDYLAYGIVFFHTVFFVFLIKKQT